MSNYLDVKNYIHNDLKLSKEDIMQVVENTVKVEINKLLKDDSYLSTLINNEVLSSLKRTSDDSSRYFLYNPISMIKSEVVDNIVNLVKDNVEISLKPSKGKEIK